MNKFITYFVVLITVAFVSVPAFAKVTSTPTPTPNLLEQKLTDLKDNIASRVAELKLVEKRGIVGQVTDVSPTQITLKDIQGNTRFIDVDELTKFSSPTSKSFGISDITKGMTLGILGLYNKDSRRLLARFIDVLTVPLYLTGGISDIDKTNYNFTLVTADKKSFTIDVENITKTNSYDDTNGLTKSGFSKIVQAERVIVVGTPDVKNQDHIIASRIILFPTLPMDPKITIFKPQDLDLQGTIVPSTGSGRKLTPLTK